MEHELKIYPNYFEDVISGKKTFEVRKNDRKFNVGDTLAMKEWDNIRYSGKEVKAKIIYMLDDRFVGIMPGYVILGIELPENFLTEVKHMESELERYIKKLKRLKDHKEKEPTNSYHDWDEEIEQAEHNIAECVVEQFSD